MTASFILQPLCFQWWIEELAQISRRLSPLGGFGEPPILFGLVSRRCIPRLPAVTTGWVQRLVLPARVRRPNVVEVKHRSWTVHAFELGQRTLYYLVLVVNVKWSARGMSQGVIKEYRARRVPGLDNIESARHREGRDANRFQVACDQTHGLMAHRSHRHQIGDVNLLLAKTLLDFGNELFAHPALRIDSSHTRVELGREFPDNPLGLQGAHGFDR